MKTLRQLPVALAVTFVLTMPAFAGQMDTMVAPPPPAAVTEGQMDTTAAGHIETPGSEEATAADSATEVALNLLQSVLSLF